MKRVLTILLGLTAVAALSARASLFEFDLTGPGGTGLLPANEIPPSLSTARGTELASQNNVWPGFVYDDSSKTFQIHYGWGNDQFVPGGQDLTAPFQQTGIYGPASQIANSSTPTVPLYEFSNGGTYDYFSPATFADGRRGYVDSPENAGLQLVDLGSYTVAQQEQDLKNGLWYINVFSTNPLMPNGEIRGQLTMVPEPQTYSLVGGVILGGFSVYRRLRLKRKAVGPC